MHFPAAIRTDEERVNPIADEYRTHRNERDETHERLGSRSRERSRERTNPNPCSDTHGLTSLLDWVGRSVTRLAIQAPVQRPPPAEEHVRDAGCVEGQELLPDLDHTRERDSRNERGR